MTETCIEVCGASFRLPELTVSTANGALRYVIDPALKRGMRFRAGVFFSKKLLSDEVFRYARAQRIGVLVESPLDASYGDIPEVVRRFPVVFTHQRELIDRGDPFRSLMFGTNWLAVRDERSTAEMLAEHPEKSAMVSFIGSLQHPDVGAYRFRREVAEYLLQRGDVECYGRGIRETPGKREALAPFRFSVAMENAASDFYFTEKLVDCLLTETVPIYFGCPSIDMLFDPRGMLRFATLDELNRHLDRLTPELYDEMRPYALANKEAVVAKRWHNHAGLLSRLSDQLPAAALAQPERRHAIDSTIDRVGSWFRRTIRWSR